MIDPVFVELGPVTIRWYGVMMAMGFIAALVNWSVLGKKDGRDVTFCSDLLFWIMVSGILGARVAYVMANWDIFAQDPFLIPRLDQGGLIFYGGLIGSLMAIALFARAKNQPIVALYDFAATSVGLSHALGRVGCYLNGCCHGTPLAGGEGKLFPLQLVEAGYNIAIYMLIVLLFRRRKRDGIVSSVYLIIYPLGRFFLELLRGDDRTRVAALSVAQIISLTIAFSGIVMFVFFLRKPVSKSE